MSRSKLHSETPPAKKTPDTRNISASEKKGKREEEKTRENESISTNFLIVVAAIVATQLIC